MVCSTCPGSWVDIKRINSRPVCKFCNKKWPAPQGGRGGANDHSSTHSSTSDSESDASQSSHQRVQFDREDDKHFAVFDRLLQKHRKEGKGCADALERAKAEWADMCKKEEEESKQPASAMDDDTYHCLLGRRKQLQQTVDRATAAYRRKLEAMESSKRRLDSAFENMAKLEFHIDEQDRLRAQKKQLPEAASVPTTTTSHQSLLQHELLNSDLLQGLDESDATKVRGLQEQLRSRAESWKKEEEERQARLQEDKLKCDTLVAELFAYKKESHKETDPKKSRTELQSKSEQTAPPEASATASEAGSFCSVDSSDKETMPTPRSSKAREHAAAKLRHQQREQEIKTTGMEEARARVAKQHEQQRP